MPRRKRGENDGSHDVRESHAAFRFLGSTRNEARLHQSRRRTHDRTPKVYRACERGGTVTEAIIYFVLNFAQCYNDAHERRI
mgnify:CR=1 FL=1